MANCNTQQLNITCGTDVVLHDRLIFDGETFDPNLSVGIAANLVSSLGKRTALDVQVVDDELLISVPWVDGTLPGCYGLEVTGSCNSKKWATYADSLIKYTKATRIGASEVTVESDSYDITQEVGYRYNDSPVKYATATIDDNVGEPSVDVTYEQHVLGFEFHNMKGNGITDIDVDEQVGDEAVNTVTIKTDADQEGTEFQVRNGSRGNGIASSSEQLSDQDGGTNTFTITDDDGNTHEFHSKNGTKGSQGDSAVYDPSSPDTPDFVMANTTGDSTTKAMTQKAVTDATMESMEIDMRTIDPSIVGTLVNKYITSNKWTSGSSSKNGYFIPVTPYKHYRITRQDKGFHFFFTKDMYSDTNNAPHYAGGLTTDPGWTSEGSVLVTAPSDAAYLWVRNMNVSEDSRLPEIVEIGTTKERIDKLDKIIFEPIPADLSNSVSGYVSPTIGDVATYTSSQLSISYKNIIPVAKGFHYSVHVQNAAEPESTYERDSVVVDDSNIVVQAMEMKVNAGELNEFEFTAAEDGHLILCCDKNATSIDIRGYKAPGDINTLFSELAKKKDVILYSNSATFGHTSYVDPHTFHFKAGKTYVFVVKGTTTVRCTCGISGMSETETYLPWTEGFDVAKFKFDEDLNGNFYIWNGSSSRHTFSYVVEEWDDTDILKLSDTGVIRVAAYNSRGSDKYISKYVCRTNENAEVVIQQAIDDLPNGGKVQLADGNYGISEVKDSGNEEIGYLGIDLGGQEVRRHIELCGVQKPIRTGDGNVETGVGAVIWLHGSAVSGFDSDTHITIIGALPIDNEYMRLPRGINLTVKNVGFNIPDNTKAIRVIDAEYCSALQVENVDMGINHSGTFSTSPNPECIGLRGLGGWNYGIYYILRCIKIHGMGVAFDLGGEHLLMEQCAVRYSDIPYRFYKYGDVSKMAHPQTMINCCEESCKKSIVFGSNDKHPAVSIIDYNIELRSGGAWNRSQKAVEESPGDICGNINFVANNANYVNTSQIQFWESDNSGKNVVTKNDADLLSGTAAQRPPYPNFGQRYYDTTLGTFVTYNGSEWI